jgi:hypothetical protein
MHTGFDNLSFADRATVLVAEYAGDTLHTQARTLRLAPRNPDGRHYATGRHKPVRVMYVGRDVPATITYEPIRRLAPHR